MCLFVGMKPKTSKDSSTGEKVNWDNYIIAIPSYKRPELLYKKTLATLLRHLGTDSFVWEQQIYIFVASQEQLDEYVAARPTDFPIGKNSFNWVIGEKGLKNQRNYIMDYFPENTMLVQMDDDIDDVLELVVDVGDPKNNKKYKTRSITNLDAFIRRAFDRCRSAGAYIWGIYPVPNAYFMTPTVTEDLRFIVGPMFGIINRHTDKLKLTTNEKENVERTLQYFTLDGRVVRYNNVTVMTRYFKTIGGMQASVRSSTRRNNAGRAAEYLNKLYPNLTKIYLGKKSGWPELKLLNQAITQLKHPLQKSRQVKKTIKKSQRTKKI